MLRLQNISKSFPGVKALTDVSIVFNAGEVHALCGENGAGKSTLMNIIAGNIQPDEGSIFLHGNKVQLRDIQAARELGTGIVYQERSLAGALTVAENIYPVNQPLNGWGLIDHKALNRQAQALLDELELKDLTPDTRVDKLSAAQKQMVEIAKALAQDPSLLILDEPTASITHRETATLFTIIRRLKQKGVAIIYISHRMSEIKEIADVVSVLKDGAYMGTYPVPSTDTSVIVTRMVGRELQQEHYVSHARQEVALEVKGLSGNGFEDISFTLRKGEILGIAGLQGSGRTALALAVFGDTGYRAGEIFKEAARIHPQHPAAAIQAGIAYLPEERKESGLFMEQSIADNIIAAKLEKGYYNRAANNRVSAGFAGKLRIATPSLQQNVQKLSGGNQQKVVLAKWLHTEPDIFIVNEPTHGVDVGAKADIYRHLKEITAAGKSILLISSELPELLLLSDRIAVMYNGHMQGFLGHEEATEEKITAMASGI